MVVLKEETIPIPDHKDDLKQGKKILTSVEKEITYFKDLGVELTRTQRKVMYAKISELLDLIGELSKPIFNSRIAIEESYRKKYDKQPALGKKLWLDHYEGLHKPYDQLKNKCWNLLSKLDPDCEFNYEEI